ncbi:acyltransferase [Parapedobacter koreensis]|uniref:MBOAT, membrane-bound O-acyltransferase family n=1 Tax=Parapedobacter koreensis TaxID=332977 RepID=A0A1H7PYQ0_9SPHI|nr:acyltransferase [Parapedobacter koreensis]SEL40689.1 hypothetical protein SAMN05421740_10575 [Parapedobacter koreensis]
MTLSEYVKKRNGVPFGHPSSLRNNLYRSLGAKNFSAFWNFWNPVFSYYLGTKIFRPLKMVLPAAVSLLLTFMICGLVHDLVTSLVRGKISLFFAVWFLLMGLVVLVTKKFHYDLSLHNWVFRASVNIIIIGFCFFLAHSLNTILNFY